MIEKIDFDQLKVPGLSITFLIPDDEGVGPYLVDFSLWDELIAILDFTVLWEVVYASDFIMPDTKKWSGYGPIIYANLESFFRKIWFRFIVGNNAPRVQRFFVNKMGRVLVLGNAQIAIARWLNISSDYPFNTIKWLTDDSTDWLTRTTRKYHRQVFSHI